MRYADQQVEALKIKHKLSDEAIKDIIDIMALYAQDACYDSAVRNEVTTISSEYCDKLDKEMLPVKAAAVELFEGDKEGAEHWLNYHKIDGLSAYQLTEMGRGQEVLDLIARIENGVFS